MSVCCCLPVREAQKRLTTRLGEVNRGERERERENVTVERVTFHVLYFECSEFKYRDSSFCQVFSGTLCLSMEIPEYQQGLELG
jgi:hypothetical protein